MLNLISVFSVPQNRHVVAVCDEKAGVLDLSAVELFGAEDSNLGLEGLASICGGNRRIAKHM